MSTIIVILAAFICLGEAKPRTTIDDFIHVNPVLIGGYDTVQGAWPWMLSMQHLSSSWVHQCGASLLSSTQGITAAHCVDGTSVSTLRVVAGQYTLDDYTGTVISDLSSYTVHPDYNTGTVTYSNDIATIHFQTSINQGTNIAYGTLPPNNDDDFANIIGSLVGWGRTSSSMGLSNTLQEAQSPIIGLLNCQNRMSGIAEIWVNQICQYENSGTVSLCNGDSGGPVNCPISGGGYYVCGLISFGVMDGSDCDANYPTVSTRTGSYLNWIAAN